MNHVPHVTAGLRGILQYGSEGLQSSRRPAAGFSGNLHNVSQHWHSEKAFMSYIVGLRKSGMQHRRVLRGVPKRAAVRCCAVGKVDAFQGVRPACMQKPENFAQLNLYSSPEFSVFLCSHASKMAASPHCKTNAPACNA